MPTLDPGRLTPILCSVTSSRRAAIADVTGQTVEAFWNSISHVPLFSVGMNCALGPKELRPLIEELSGIAPIYVSAYPNAGLPNPLLPTGFPETPESLAPQLREWAQNGWLNIVGGCCGTTPAHIKAIAEAVRGLPPRKVPTVEPYLRLSGLEAVTVRPDSNFLNIGERTNVAGSPKFAQLIKAGDYEAALAIARQQVENGAQVIDVCMDEGMIDGVAAMTRFLNLVASRAGHLQSARHGGLVEMGGHRGRAEMPPGQGHRQLDQPQGRRREVSAPGEAGPPLRRGGRRHGF